MVIINNNGGLYGGRHGRGSMPLGMERSWVDQPDSDFASVAKGFGVEAERVLTFDQVVPAIRRAIAADGPYVLDLRTAGSNLTGTLPSHDFMPKKFGHGDRRVEGSWPSR